MRTCRPRTSPPAPASSTDRRHPQAYASGRGAITVEAVASTETRTGNLPRIVVTEIPYQVNKSALLERIADLVATRKLEAIRDLRDESSRDGMRIVIELKRGEDPAAVLAKLYAHRPAHQLQRQLVALVDGAPRTLGLREALCTTSPTSARC
jgi:DNA gyrase subunit A